MIYKVFIDTNILIYSMDNFDKKKRKRCRIILKELAESGTGVISTQVLQEFYVAATRKLKLNPIDAKKIIHSFKNFEVVTVTSHIVDDAIDCSILNSLSFWDSLIICSAEFAHCESLLTEDLNPGQIIRSVKIDTPF
jgi:predicted nucleic acid-binding protein